MKTLADYLANLPPTPQAVSERRYVANRAPKLAELYLRDRRIVAEAFDAIAEIVAADRPKPADLELLLTLSAGSDAELGAQVRRAIDRHVARQADTDASDEASEMFERGVAA